MKGYLLYILNEVRNVLGRKILRMAISVVCICAVWWGLLPHFDSILQTLIERWIEPLNQCQTIVALYILVFIGLTSYLYEHIRKMAHLRTTVWCALITLSIIYSYYRFAPQSPFDFWSNAWWTWADILYVVDIILFGCEISYKIRFYIYSKRQGEKVSDLLLDNAIIDEQYDFLDYTTQAHELMVCLNAVNLSKHAFSVGIVGEWGLGKSSLLNLFAHQVEKSGQILVRFSPRNAKQADLIQEEFFSSFTEVLSKYSYNAHYLVSKYAYALNAHSSTKWIYALIHWFNNKTAAENKERINDLIRATGKRVFVIIEDLDRLSGQEILEVLKLIDANGNFCNTIFLSAYDKIYVNNVLNHVIGYGDVSQDFTDKFFQYELTLFKHPNSQLYSYITEKMYEWAVLQHTEKSVQQQIQKEWNRVYTRLIPYIRTLRQAKRYINLFRMVYGVQKNEVNFADCAIVTLIRYMDYQAYYDLYSRKYLTYEGVLQIDKTQYKLASDYEKIVGQSSIPHLSQLLSFLFDTADIRQFDPMYNRLCRTESFEKYFYQAIKGKVYSEELNMMMNVDTEQSAIGIMQSIIYKSHNSRNSIREFLWNRQADWIQTPARLKRYMCMLLYAEGTIQDVGLTSTINDMLHTQVAAGYERYMTREEYVKCVILAFEIMQQYVPLMIGKYMHIRLKDRYGDAAHLDEYCVESIYQDQSIMEEAQRSYDQLHGKHEWSPLESIRMATRIDGEDETRYKIRAMHLKRMMTIHADEYADSMINFYEVQRETKETRVSLNYYDEIVELLGGQRSFKSWIRGLSNKDLRYIVWELNYYAQSGYAHETGLGKVIDNPKQNYVEVAEIIRKSSARANIRARKREMKNEK